VYQEKSGRKIKRMLLVQLLAFGFHKKGDIDPNVPLGIAYIAAVLEKNGYGVKILDAFNKEIVKSCSGDNFKQVVLSALKEGGNYIAQQSILNSSLNKFFSPVDENV